MEISCGSRFECNLQSVHELHTRTDFHCMYCSGWGCGVHKIVCLISVIIHCKSRMQHCYPIESCSLIVMSMEDCEMPFSHSKMKKYLSVNRNLAFKYSMTFFGKKKFKFNRIVKNIYPEHSSLATSS